MKNKLQNFASLLAVVFFLFIAFGSGDSEGDKKESTSAANEEPATSSEAETTPEEPAEPEKVENWRYNESEDEMSGQKKFYSETTSTNKIEFEFPYDGGSNFTLAVRNHGKRNEVLFAVSKGQIMPSYKGEKSVRIKFDDDELISYPYNSPSTGESDIIFIQNADDVVEKLKTAKQIKVEVPYYQAGRQIAKFDVEGFTWEH